MQFRAVEKSDVAGPQNASPSGRLESDSLLLSLQPGRIVSIKQQRSTDETRGTIKRGRQGDGNNQRVSESPGRYSSTKVNLQPEPIDYLRLRRTEDSVRALQRNRTQHVLVQEILQPSPLQLNPLPVVTEKWSSKKTAAVVEQQAAVQHMDRVLEEMKHRVLSSTHANDAARVPKQAAALASQLQQLYRQQHQIEKESAAASHRVQEILTSVRNDITLMYKFTPLFKIYTRHKTKSAWHRWQQFIHWHREEEAQLALLWPYALKIQQVFRRKRYQWQLARQRMALAWGQWQASLMIQRLARMWLARREMQRRSEDREAVKLQAAWRGQRDRKWVKKLLRDQLRVMLRSLSPTGSLHRLSEVAHLHPELAQPLDRILSLIEETHVAVEAGFVYKAKNARIAARMASRPIEATRRQLFLAVFELSAIITDRDRAVVEAKQTYVTKQHEKQSRKQREEAQVQAQRLLQVREKLQADQEQHQMQYEELWMREYLRMLKTADTDRILHMKLDRQRREQAENAKMVVEEYLMRYYVSETRRRQQDDERRLAEVERRQQLLREEELKQTQHLKDLLQTDEMKRREIHDKKEHAKAVEQAQLAKLSKEQAEEARRRLDLKKQQEDEEKMRARAIADAQLAHERELSRRREESRVSKQQELAKESAKRDAMAAEEKECRRVYFEWKKALHAETWRAKREKELVRYSLDPMHYAKVQAVKELEERERRERYWMKKEDEWMTAIHERERKEAYFAQCRERRRMEKVDAKRAQKERVLMDEENERASQLRLAEQRARDYERTLAEMENLAKQNEARKQRQLQEAKNRKLMFDEEMRQRRVELAIKVLHESKENHERSLMAKEEQDRRVFDAKMLKKANKRFRERCILQMMKEDVMSMERQDIEEEGHRLERLLWEPDIAAALSQLVMEYPGFLATNVMLIKDLGGCIGAPPFDLDYEAVHRHRNDEQELSPHKVQRKKKRQPRKFFYHEFFEEDPILAKYKRPDPEAPTPAQLKARERWQQVARHFLGTTRTNDEVREAYLLMSRHKYAEACAAFATAVRLERAAPKGRSKSAALLRQAARCCVKEWEQHVDHQWLEKGLFYFHGASAHVGMLTNPHFLQEIALVLERLGRYREAGEVLSGIIACFPRYNKLHEVIFRGGVVLMALHSYQQSREYLMHTLDQAPFGWAAHEILMLAARVMQLEGKPRRKLCAVAYEEAFRSNKRDAYYRTHATWKEWIKAATTWRELGDRYYARQEYGLARDAYQVMMKRITKMKAITNGARTRQHIVEARRVSVQERAMTEMEDGDWLRLAKSATTTGDRAAAASAMRRWLASKSYQDRVLDQYYSWPLARWKLLGIEVPQRVVEALERKKRESIEAEEAKLKQIQERRQLVLKQRSIKARERMIAWGDDPEGTAILPQPSQLPASGAVDQQDHVGNWVRVTDAETQEAYYWNEETGETSYDPPSI